MTIDKAQLQALAQSVADLEDIPERAEEHAEANDALWLHMHCHTILDLLAEIERLESEAMYTAAGVQSDREQIDQLKAENEALRKDAERYRWLRDQNPNAFYLERNTGNSVNYCTVAQWIEDNPEWFDGTPDGDLEKMAQTNSHWQIQIYPDTPIGFYVTSRATLDEVIDAVIAEESNR